RQDGDAESAENLRQVRGLRVHPQSRFRHPAQAGDRTFPIGSELEVQEQRLADLGVLDAPVGDVALGLEDLGDVRLELRERHADVLVVSRVGFAQTREHVCDWNILCIIRESVVMIEYVSVVNGRCGLDHMNILTANNVLSVSVLLLGYLQLRKDDNVVTDSVILAIRESAKVSYKGESL